MISYEMESINQSQGPKIVVLGIGGAGGNAINSIGQHLASHITCVAINTDLQALQSVKTPNKILLGEHIVKGMGTGANPEIGKVAAEEDIQQVIDFVHDANIVFLIGGLGGGTGSGAIPVIARLLQEKQILSVALVTKPFLFEGSRRMAIAINALNKIEEYVDTLIVVPNQKLFDANNSVASMPMIKAFEMVNDVIVNCIKAIVETIYHHGYVNVDFADIKTIMTRMGKAIIGIGKASGENRAHDAIASAISSPLLEHTSLKGASSILLNISCDSSLTLQEMNMIAGYIHDQAHPEAHIIVGSSIIENQVDELQLIIIATGFDDQIKTRTASRHTSATAPLFSQGLYGNQYGQKTPFTQTPVKPQIIDHSSLYANIPPTHGQNQKYPSPEAIENNVDIPAFLRKTQQEYQK